MAPKSKDSRTRFGEPLATDVAAFRAAIGMGASEIGVIREAVSKFIEHRLSKDKALKQRFDLERQRIQAERIRPLRIVKSSDDTK